MQVKCLITFLLIMVLSIVEHVFLVEHTFREDNKTTYTDLVQEQFPETPVPHRRLIEKFHETVPVLDAERSWRTSKLNDEKLLDISDSVLRSPSKSLRKLAQGEVIGLATADKTSENN
jgi:hypothetical protein